jgi:hypothetical protein
VIDPRPPDPAAVYALLVKRRDLGRLRDQLKDVGAAPVEERAPEPAIVTQLSDIDRVEEFASVAPADVLTPREALALRIRGRDAENVTQSASPAADKPRMAPTPEQYRSAPVPVTNDDSDEKILVLIWVSTTRPS